MDELTRITQDFLQGQELMLRAFNALLAYQRPRATGLFPVFSAPVLKPQEGANAAPDRA